MVSKLKKCPEKADMKDLCTLCLFPTRLELLTRTLESQSFGGPTASMSREVRNTEVSFSVSGAW